MVNLTIYLAALIILQTSTWEVISLKQNDLHDWSVNMEIIDKNNIYMDIFYIEVYLYNS